MSVCVRHFDHKEDDRNTATLHLVSADMHRHDPILLRWLRMGMGVGMERQHG